MDDKSTQLLQEILNQQKEQTELFRRYLWRIRFSLLGLMLLMTLLGVALGVGVYMTRPTAIRIPGPRVILPTPVAPPTFRTNPYQNYQTPPNKVEPDPVG
jgi:hypothetical protein